MFPAHHTVSPGIYRELKGMIVHASYGQSCSRCRPFRVAYAGVDALSSEKSVAAYESSEFMHWLQLIQHLEGPFMRPCPLSYILTTSQTSGMSAVMRRPLSVSRVIVSSMFLG
jgi:hypothetical protein